MKSRLLLVLIVTLNCAVAMAQKIQVVDTDDLPIPAVCVTDENGVIVGTTDNNGWLDDAKGKSPLYFSHTAFKSKNLYLSDIVDSKVVLEDVNYELAEVTVKPKELLYVQTYFRCIYVSDDGPIYFRAGVIDNTYEYAKKKLSAKTKSVSKGANGFYRFIISTLVGRYIDGWAKLDTTNLYKKVTRLADKGKLTISEDAASGRRIVSDSVSALGFIEEDMNTRFRTTSFDQFTYIDRIEAAKELEKSKKKGKEPKEKKRKYREGEHGYYEICRFNEDGYSGIGDMIMKQVLSKGHFESSDEDYILLLETFTTDIDYIDKKEFKQTRKDNAVDMNILELRQFEKAHNIPELAPNLKAAVDKLFEKELKKNKEF